MVGGAASSLVRLSYTRHTGTATREARQAGRRARTMSARLDVATVSLHCLYTRVLVRRARFVRLDVVTVSLHCLYTRVLVRRASCVAPPRPTRSRRRVPTRDRPTAPHCPPCARNLAREARPRRPRRPRLPRMTFLERLVVEDALDSRKRASTSRKRVDKNSWRMTRRRRRGARARWVYPVVPCGCTRANARGMIASSR